MDLIIKKNSSKSFDFAFVLGDFEELELVPRMFPSERKSNFGPQSLENL